MNPESKEPVALNPRPSDVEASTSETVTQEKPVSITAGAIAYLLFLAICIALIRPFVNAGISDDFGYVKSAKDFADTGKILYYGAATPMLGWLIPFGGLFIKLFGFSFTAARVGSFLIAAVNGVLLQWILLRLGCSRVQALFGATAVLLSPASLPEAMLFFTDGPGLLVMLVTLVLCIRIVRAQTSRATQIWIAAAFLVSFLLGTVRQLLWMSTFVMVPSAIWLVRKRRGVVPWAAVCFVLAAIGIAGTLHWWNHQPFTLREPLIGHYPLDSWARYLIFPGMELAVLMAPALSLFMPRRVPVKVYLVSAVVAALSLLVMIRNPYNLPRMASHQFFGNAPEWIFLTALTYSCLLAPVAMWAVYVTLTRHQGADSAGQIGLVELAVLLAPFTFAVFLLVSSRGSFWLRYLLEVMTALTIWMVKLWSDMARGKKAFGLAGPALVAVYCALSVMMMHDTFRDTAATLSLTQWYTDQDMPRDQLEAGYAFDGWYQIERAGHVYDRRIMVPAGVYMDRDLPRYVAQCHNFFLPNTPSIHPIYGISETMNQCFEPPILHSVEYAAWMPPRRHTVFIARYAPQYALPSH